MIIAAEPRWQRLRPVARPALVALAIAAGTLLLLAAILNGEAQPAAGLAVMALIAAAALRWPAGTAIVFCALVPVNRFLILLVFHYTGSLGLTQVAQLWKDGLIAVLLARALYELLFTTGAKRLLLLDLVVLAFLGLSAVYLLLPASVGDHGVYGRLLGFRADSYFMLAYFVGRGLPLTAVRLRWLVVGLIPGSIAVAVVAGWEFFRAADANAFFGGLGYAAMVRAEGATQLMAVRPRGVAGVSVDRASSLLMGDLALAFYQILLVALAAALFFERGRRRYRLAAGGFLLLMLATLALTVTRSAVIATLPVLLLAAMLSRSFGRLAIVGMTLAATVLLVVVAWPELDSQHFDLLLSPGEGSVQAHLLAVSNSLDPIMDRPFGHGYGTAGAVGRLEAGSAAVNNENWFLQIATEIGVVPAALYLLAVLGLIWRSIVNYGRVSDPWLRTVVLGMAGGGVGFLVIGNVLHAWEVSVLSILFWLLAGIAVRADDLEASPLYAEGAG